MKKLILIFLISVQFIAQKNKTPFVWEGANLYFLMVDRFNNGDKKNDLAFNRTKKCAPERGYQGGDIRGIIQKIDEDYFTKLGTNVIWLTPIVEQVKDGVDEGYGFNYAFHGYWTRDWTNLDPTCGTKKDLAEMVEKAHKKGIRIMLDAVINHTGPVTLEDSVWPSDWVRTEPQCKYSNYENTTACTLVKNLPDVDTETDKTVELPAFLIEKWKKEGAYEKEMASLDAFFKRTGYPRAPKYYIIKWLTDYILEFGIDGYRCDTVKHTNPEVWSAFKAQCEYAFAQWKKNNPTKVLDNNPFHTVAEVYGYGIDSGLIYDFSDKKVNYFENGFNSMINFNFRWDAEKESYEKLFAKYSNAIQNNLNGNTIMNYLSSHDDANPFDNKRKKGYEAANKLLLTPGISQTYFGDESNRPLIIKGTTGDATLRTFMNWNDLKTNAETKKMLNHWQKIGQFRKNHPAVGAGKNTNLASNIFKREYSKNDYFDKVIIGLDLKIGLKEITLDQSYKNGAILTDTYSGKSVIVKNGKININTPYTIVLLETKIN